MQCRQQIMFGLLATFTLASCGHSDDWINKRSSRESYDKAAEGFALSTEVEQPSNFQSNLHLAWDRGFKYTDDDPAVHVNGTFQRPSIYSSLSMSRVPAALKRVYGASVKMDFGDILTNATRLKVATEVLTNDTTVPTACVLQELKNKQASLGLTDQGFEDYAVKHGLIPMPIDESLVHPGAERVLYSFGLIRTTGPRGGNLMTGSCLACHSTMAVVRDNMNNATVEVLYGASGVGIGTDTDLGLSILQDGADLAMRGGCGMLTPEEATAAATMLEAQDELDSTGAQIGTNLQRDRISRSAFLLSTQLGNLGAHWASGAVPRTRDFDQQVFDNGFSGEVSFSGGPDYNNAMTFAPRSWLEGSDFAKRRASLLARYQNNESGNQNSYYSNRKPSSWFAWLGYPDTSFRVFSGAYGCGVISLDSILGTGPTPCGVQTMAFILTLPLNARTSLGVLDPDIAQAVGLPPGTKDSDYRVYLSAKQGETNSEMMFNDIYSTGTGPQALPNVAATRGITMAQLQQAVSVVNSKCISCHTLAAPSPMTGEMVSEPISLTTSGVPDANGNRFYQLYFPASPLSRTNAALPVANNKYVTGVAKSYAEQDGNFLQFSAPVRFYTPTSSSGDRVTITYSYPSNETELNVMPWHGVWPAGVYGTLGCFTDLNKFFDFNSPDLSKHQPDLVAIDHNEFDITTGGYKVLESVQHWSQADYDRLVAKYGSAYIYNKRAHSECDESTVPTYMASFHGLFSTLSDSDKAAIKNLVVVMGAAETPGIYDSTYNQYVSVKLKATSGDARTAAVMTMVTVGSPDTATLDTSISTAPMPDMTSPDAAPMPDMTSPDANMMPPM